MTERAARGVDWLIIDVILVVALGAAILWGTHQWRQGGASRRMIGGPTRP